jgi:LmbE family N-acetylglucosaminyl deacetylase
MSDSPHEPPGLDPAASGEETMSAPAAAVDAQAVATAREAASDQTGPAIKRIAVFMAHPDDAEFTCAGTVALWAAAGHHITYVLLTSGDKGSADLTATPERLVEIRTAEQRTACDVLGVQDIVFMGYQDSMLVADLALRRELVRVIRRIKPDVVIGFDPTVRWVDQSYINHPDHRAAGEATLDAVYPTARDWMTFPELLAEGLEPHKVAEVYLAGAKEPDCWIDISAQMETKLAALRAHASQLGDWDPEEMIRTWARETAERNPNPHHGEFAESYKYFKLD